MTDLSPAALAVWHAYEIADCDPYLIDPRQAGVAAALRAAADQVVPTTVDPRLSTVRSDLMRIARELEALPDD